MQTKRIFFGLIFFFLLLPGAALAHLPRIVAGGDLMAVQNPEISQAFYGELGGAPHFFQININKPIELYVNILVPDIKGVKKNISAEIYRQSGDVKTPLATLDGTAFAWTPFYEEFANDNYFKGPEFKTQATAGTYIIKILSPNNRGKYVFVVGETESFTLGESVRLLTVLPALKMNFFEKSPLTLAASVLGKFFLGGLAAIIVLIILVIFLIKIVLKRLKGRK